jgi:phage anti-repressor protein
MEARTNLDIPDGEFLHYSIYTGGVKTDEYFMVTRYLTNNLIKIYYYLHHLDSDRPVPSHYTNYPWYIVVDLKTASTRQYIIDDTDYYVKQNKKKGTYYMEVNIGKELNAVKKIWDGNEIREMRINVKKIDTNSAIWCNETIIMAGTRLLNWEKGGVVYSWTDVMKEPIPSLLFIKGKGETVTPLGTFKTYKIGQTLADPFLGWLLKPFTETVKCEVENSPKHRLIKMRMEVNNQDWILDKAEIWK